MHELSLCRSIYGIADRARGGRQVRVVYVRIGQLRQVVPATLEYCWGLVTETTPLAGSRLDVEHVPITVSCRACGADTPVAHELLLCCADCGSGEVAVTSGEEMLVASLDLAAAAIPENRPSEKS